MNYYPEYIQLALQEVPGEIAVVIPLSGCGHKCRGCHSPMYQDKDRGELLTTSKFDDILHKYERKASCVLLFNGEHEPDSLFCLINIAKLRGFKVALYSGYELDELDPRLVGMLDYLKTGSYIEKLGGLDKVGTNQRLWKRIDGKLMDITAEMQREVYE
jgi:anaerobic ribonucleoside-triphosphate reductase activating protein